MKARMRELRQGCRAVPRIRKSRVIALAGSLFLAVCAAAGAQSAGLADVRRNELGLNTWFLTDWDGSFAFVDAMKHARPWQDGADWHKPVASLDANGWPLADASTVFATGTPSQINGKYHLSFAGQAEVSLLWAPGTVAAATYDAASNTSTAEVTIALVEKGSVGLVFRNTRHESGAAAGSGFSDVRLTRPGYPFDGGQVFTTPFLKAMSGFEAARLMDWTSTNDNLVVKWSERMKPRDMARPGFGYKGPGGGTWDVSQLGIALEHQIQLCNALHASFWVNVPVAANDDYARKLALAIRYGTDGVEPYAAVREKPTYPPLDPGLKVYVEYANEVWNSAGGFYCFGVVKDLVSALPDDHELLLPPEENIYALMWRYPAWRIATISDIFRSIVGDAAMMDRIRPVLMTQQGNAQATLSQALLWLDAYGHRQKKVREVSSYIYGAGGSAYYGVSKPPRNQSDVEAFFAPGNYPATSTVKAFGVDSVWGANFGLKHVAYEGGPSLDGFQDANAQRVNLDPRMEDLVTKTHDAWSAQGGDLLVYYTLRGPSKWEFTPDLENTDTPKYRALLELRARPRAKVTLGPSLPGTLVAADESSYRIKTGSDYARAIGGLACISGYDPGKWIALAGHADKAFKGHLRVSGASDSLATLAIWVNGVRQGVASLAAGSALSDSSSIEASIPAGLVVVRVEVLKGSLTLRSVMVE